mmetsp:Transcript_25072/g.99726  ORF Transcript_25072/g.99726 Transcript_25072/m.99726 type:complete len:205 (-) Transcript_25072:103-717(-)
MTRREAASLASRGTSGSARILTRGVRHARTMSDAAPESSRSDAATMPNAPRPPVMSARPPRTRARVPRTPFAMLSADGSVHEQSRGTSSRPPGPPILTSNPPGVAAHRAASASIWPGRGAKAGSTVTVEMRSLGSSMRATRIWARKPVAVASARMTSVAATSPLVAASLVSAASVATSSGNATTSVEAGRDVDDGRTRTAVAPW